MAVPLAPDRARADLREAARSEIQLTRALPRNPGSLARGARRLPHDRDRRMRAVRDHRDVVGLYDEPRVEIPFLLQHHLGELRIVVDRLETFVALFFRGIPAHIDECVFRTDAELCVALLRDPVADVRNSMPRINRGRAVGKPSSQGVSLSRLRGVDAQLVKSNRVLLLRESPTHPGQSESDSEERCHFPLQPEELLWRDVASYCISCQNWPAERQKEPLCVSRRCQSCS